FVRLRGDGFALRVETAVEAAGENQQRCAVGTERSGDGMVRRKLRAVGKPGIQRFKGRTSGRKRRDAHARGQALGRGGGCAGLLVFVRGQERKRADTHGEDAKRESASSHIVRVNSVSFRPWILSSPGSS